MNFQHKVFAPPNITAYFPYQPYQSQVTYMQNIVKALTNKGHALLESPTGTGKTLSLLCSTLAWHQHQPNPAPMIYYASRTHIQIGQAAKEMKRTIYSRVPAVVIGARKKMCLNDELRHVEENVFNRECRNAIARNGCEYYRDYELKMERMDTNKVYDIEELTTFGKSRSCCPYYASKKLAESKASVVFTPYNYLLNASSRKAFQLKLDSSIVIFDEAHNIEDCLKDAMSAKITKHCLNTIIESCDSLPSLLSDALTRDKGISTSGYEPKKQRNKNDLGENHEAEHKKSLLQDIAEVLTNENLKALKNTCLELIERLGKLKPGSYEIPVLFTIFEKCINFSNSSKLTTTTESAITFYGTTGIQNSKLVDKLVSALSNLSELLQVLYPSSCLSIIDYGNHKSQLTKFYACFLELNEVKSTSTTNWELNIWCLNPALGLKDMIDSTCANGVRSFIITSGTLAPLCTFTTELGIKFEIVNEFSHIISETQMKMFILGQSPSGQSLDSTYKSTQQKEYPQILGNSLQPLLKILPFGTVVFFPSFTLMKSVHDSWATGSNILVRMRSITKVYFGIKGKEEYELDKFKRDIDKGNNAVFFSYCRGKLSEGVSLEGNYCRAVIMTGLPFPLARNPKVIETRKFQHRHRNDHDGRSWYVMQMAKAMNQTIGRVIRHKNDFGIVILCDPRFMGNGTYAPKWVQKFYPQALTSYVDLEDDIKEFFLNHEISISRSASHDAGCFEISFTKPASKSHQVESKKTFHSKTSLLDNPSALLASYTVSREEYARITAKRAETHQSNISKKQKRDTTQVFNDVYCQIEAQSSQEAVVPPKKPCISRNPFAKKSSVVPSLNEETSIIATNTQKSGHSLDTSTEYSVLEQLTDTSKKLVCSICKNKPKGKLFKTDCKCVRAGCKGCLKVLHKKRCHKCKIVLNQKHFKPIFFNSLKSNRNYVSTTKESN